MSIRQYGCMNHDGYVDVYDLARGTKLPVKFLRREAISGRLPHLKAGRRLLFNPQSVADELRLRERAALGDRPRPLVQGDSPTYQAKAS